MSGTVGGVSLPEGDAEVVVLCDTQTSGAVVAFLRRYQYDSAGTITGFLDRQLDGTTVYAPTGTVGRCTDSAEAPDTDVELVVLCDVAADGTSTPFLRRYLYDTTGTLTGFLDRQLDGTTIYAPAGTVSRCQDSAEPCEVADTFTVCKCDDTDADGVGDVDYQELWAIPCDGGTPTLLLTYRDNPATPYAPVSPVDCAAGEDADVRARRTVLTGGAGWTAALFPTLQSVTATNVGTVNATITTTDGTSTLYPGETATWSVTKDSEPVLTGPLTINAPGAALVSINFTVQV